MPPTPGNQALLDALNTVNRDLGLAPMEAFDPGRRGAADVSFVAPHTLTARALVVAPDDELTVLNLFVEYSEHVVIDSFTISLLAAVCALMGKIPTVAEYMAQVEVVNKKAADIYRYMNFDQIEEFKEIADSVGL